MIFRGVCALVVLAAVTGCSPAPPPETAPTVPLPATQAQPPAPPAPAPPKIDREQAGRLAEQAAPGFRVTAIDLDTDEGRRIWDVDLVNDRNERRDLDVDAETGQILPDLDND
ncbi:PepSY domain-containing protein [Allokutzneria albata]|uniref:Peptidase propeptide and YPEB domain-containing protein n=1 Tax=Allokutzneria albata TaxID=211114 RepID=A0A1H0DAD1_ALLAB|nr:PepSY domain-containing protein [Allokutzneria albata]SDN67103.1 Peptidase propeptide and YPEB domain-containing protein [Allokutzneria albata]